MDLSTNEGTLVVTGGPGDSVQTAIAIKQTPKGLSAAGAEHLLLAQRYGPRGRGWTLERQDLLKLAGRVYDAYAIVLQDGTGRTLYFDVTDWLARAQSSYLL
jgi:hypothetical protein